MKDKKRKMYKHGGSHDGNALAKRKKANMKGGKAKRTMYKDGGMSKAKPC
jgi:hypothetical protein